MLTPDQQTQIDVLLAQPVLARIATANPDTLQPHVVPVWFWWDGQAVWISAFDSTRKIRDLRRNPRISVLIEPPDPATSAVQAVLFEGQAVLIKDARIVREMSARIYTHYMGEEGVKAEDPQSWIVDPENTIIRLAPEKTYTW
jgi:PPOX class probable F420-dependent enzyme